jgi:hypothetical protein
MLFSPETGIATDVVDLVRVVVLSTLLSTLTHTHIHTRCAMSDPSSDPRSPQRPPVDVEAGAEPPGGGADGETGTPAPGTTPGATPAPLPLPVSFTADPSLQMQQRPNLGSMLFLTAFFFFMSNNNPPPMIVVGPDGQIVPRETQLDRARTRVDEYGAFFNGTSGAGAGNWTEAGTRVQPGALVPTRYAHDAAGAARGGFYRNITGFYRDAVAHVVDLEPGRAGGKGAGGGQNAAGRHGEGFWSGVRFPTLNTTGDWNATRAHEMRGEFDWMGVDKWDMNLRERALDMGGQHGEGASGASGSSSGSARHPSGKTTGGDARYDEWLWVRGSATLYAHSASGALASQATLDPTLGLGLGNNTDTAPGSADSVNYDFYGLHHIPNGTYGLYAQPEGVALDIRNIPRLFPGHENVTRGIVMRELRRDLEVQEASLMLADVKPDGESRKRTRVANAREEGRAWTVSRCAGEVCGPIVRG